MILSMDKTMVAKVISELKTVSRLKIFWETGHLGPLCMRILEQKTECQMYIELLIN